MKQQAVFANDRAAIAVPYEAEQKLWAALAAMPPAAAPIVSGVTNTAAPVATSSVFLKVASVALVSIVVGFATGYFFGNQPGANTTLAPASSSIAVATPTTSSATADVASSVRNSDVRSAHAHTGSIEQSSAQSHVLATNRHFPEAPLSQGLDLHASYFQVADPVSIASNESDRLIPSASALVPGTSFVRDPNNPGASRPSIWDLNPEPPKRGPRFSDYLELSIHEGIGKQFPNSSATNVSIPIVTNTDVTMKFMIAHSFWVGAGVGLANVTYKNLYEAASAPNSPTHQIYWNYEHRNTAWFGLLAEYRQPISERFTVAINGGVAASSVGPIISTEAGIRYAATDYVGALAGVRLTRSTSNVQSQHDALTSPSTGTPGLVDSPGSLNDPSMLNLEISTGIYFQF
jgi:hypothetical protein